MTMKIEEKVEDMETFKFTCPYCSSDKIELRPLGVSYTYRKDNDNSDIKDENIRKQLDKIPYIGNALLDCNQEDILVICNNCKIGSYVTEPIVRTELVSFLKKRDMEPVFNIKF